MIFIAKYQARAHYFKRLRQQNVRWLYVGKSAAKRDRVAKRLGASNRIYLGSRLQALADELRQPFLDWVAEMGARQRDKMIWWCTRISWRDWGVSDLFLLLCYLKLIESFVAGQDKNCRHCLVIEDDWLFAQLRKNFAHDRRIRFLGRSRLPVKIPAFFLRGIVVRLILPFRVMWSKLLQSYHIKASSRPPAAESHDVAIYSLPQPRCFAKANAWNDPFFPGLESFFQREGISSVRFAPVFPTGFERELGQRAALIVPLISFVEVKEVLRCILAYWPKQEASVLTTFLGSNVDVLLRKEWWAEFSSTQLCRFVLFRESVNKFLHNKKIKTILYPFENQPWEKMLCSAARSLGVRTVGYQHSTVPKLYLTQFLGKREIEFLPLPDAIMVSGEYTHRLFRDAGYPESILQCGGSWRYKYLYDTGQNGSILKMQRAMGDANRVLVLFPIDPDLCQHLISSLQNTVKNGSANGAACRFVLKPHPMTPINRKSLGNALEVSDLPLQELLDRHDLVLYSGTTSGLEALFLNKRVLRYQPETILDVDPVDALPDEVIESCNDQNIQATISGRMHPQQRQSVEVSLSHLQTELFGPVSERGWLAALFSNARNGDDKANRAEEAHCLS